MKAYTRQIKTIASPKKTYASANKIRISVPWPTWLFMCILPLFFSTSSSAKPTLESFICMLLAPVTMLIWPPTGVNFMALDNRFRKIISKSSAWPVIGQGARFSSREIPFF